MAKLTYRQAITKAIGDELRSDPDVIFFGEDIAEAGGAFKLTVGLVDEFGTERVRDTPISEQAIVGAALGASISGLRPVAELMFADFIPVAMDQIVNQVAKYRYMSDGQFTLPLTIRSAQGGGAGFASQHSGCGESWLMQHTGLLVAVPSTPRDVYGLLRGAIREDNPVYVLEHKMLFTMEEEIPDDQGPMELGKAAVRREGSDVTIVATQLMMHRSLEAAAELERRDQRRSRRSPHHGPPRHGNHPGVPGQDQPPRDRGGGRGVGELGRRHCIPRRERGHLPAGGAGEAHQLRAQPHSLQPALGGQRHSHGGADCRGRPRGNGRLTRPGGAHPTSKKETPMWSKPGPLTIKSIETQAIRVPLDKVYRGSKYSMENRCTIIVTVRTEEGVVGRTYSGDTDAEQADVIKIIERELAPALTGMDVFNTAGCWEAMKPATYDILRDRGVVLQAIAAVDTAIWDTVGKALEMPLYKIWGGYTKRLPMIAIGGYYGQNRDELAQEVQDYVDYGVIGMKFKIGGVTPEEDLEASEGRRRGGRTGLSAHGRRQPGLRPAAGAPLCSPGAGRRHRSGVVRGARALVQRQALAPRRPPGRRHSRHGGTERVPDRRCTRPGCRRLGGLLQFRCILGRRPDDLAAGGKHLLSLRRANGAPRGGTGLGAPPGKRCPRHLRRVLSQEPRSDILGHTDRAAAPQGWLLQHLGQARIRH